jgi:selenium metabolism protein YedF
VLEKELNMNEVILDCSGLPCPQPVLRAKDALAQGAHRIEMLVDNEASKNNILRFARNQGHEVTSADRPGGCFAVTITVGTRPVEQTFDPADYNCDIPPMEKLVYVISSDCMGRGSDELGWALLQTYIQTIKDVSPLPEKILLYNSGVKLVTENSGALEAFRELQNMGVEIFACGTCLDFFKLLPAIKVGQISNMYDIMNSMASADKIVSPY